MTLVRKIAYGLGLLKARCLKKRFPLAVCWYLTYRCNYNCKYCGIPELNPNVEMSTSEVFSAIDDLKKLGTKRIHFCGGESLLRKDIFDIIDYCKRSSIDVGLISNGSLVPRYVKNLRSIDELRISLDGPKHIQEELRGEGAYDRAIEAVLTAKRYGIRTVFSTTLSNKNLPFVEFVVEKSKELGVPVIFAPVDFLNSGTKDMKELIFSQKLYKEKINYLIQEAKKNRYIVNSIPGLKYISYYPDTRKINYCIGGRIFCHIKPDGQVYPCERIRLSEAPNCRIEGVEGAFKHLSSLVSCGQCWCSATLELNLIYSFNIRVIINVLKKWGI